MWLMRDQWTWVAHKVVDEGPVDLGESQGGR